MIDHEIAKALYLALLTKTYVTLILGRLGAHDRVHVIAAYQASMVHASAAPA